MRKILLDTNFLLIPYQFKVDIFSEIGRICNFKYKLCIVDKTLEELKKIIANSRGKHGKAAILALIMLDQKKAGIIKSREKNVDEAILETAAKAKKTYIVATQDAGLKRELKKKGVQLIVLKGKSHLGLLGG